MPTYRLNVNGEARSVASRDPAQPLLYVLRNTLGLTGSKFGCGLGQCGACTVWIDGQPARSCVATIQSVNGRSVTTIEGLGSPDKPHALQAAFIAEQVPQCGYCTAGMVMSGAALLQRRPAATDDEARSALAGNLCRCGSHARVLKAIARVAGRSES
jgi:nicotinate dehydrogenase subunit A